MSLEENQSFEVGENQEPMLTKPETAPEEFEDETAVLPKSSSTRLMSGVVLEAAFVDPAYSWPPADGVGKNAIELQASTALIDSKPEEDQQDIDQEMLEKVRAFSSAEVGEDKRRGRRRLWCCGPKNNAAANTYEPVPTRSSRAIVAGTNRKVVMKQKEREKRKKERYSRVPEGILIYRLDTAAHTIELVSSAHNKTDMERLLKRIVVAQAVPVHDKTRRGIQVTGIDGTKVKIVACEQRTAIAWLEAMDMMLANSSRRSATSRANNVTSKQLSRTWGKENVSDARRDSIEEEYVNLALYSNKLIRAGALPGQKGKGGAGGIYYSMEYQSDKPDHEEEALESIAKRRAVIKDSWDFYRMICSLLRDKRKYDEVFRKLQLDPVYPYLNSMTGLNDPGDSEYENYNKVVIQEDLPEYATMTKTEVANDLVKRAEEALPSLVEICKALAGSLGMEEVGVGPVKEPRAAIRKAEKKYEGDLLKVTDYCRALLVVKDLPSLLGLLELARDSFGPLIRRVKLSTLKSDHSSLPGGYRDCKINLELKDHICEIQVHLWPMWTVCGVDGFRHYRHCLEYSTDSFTDAYDSLEGLDRKTLAELIVMAEEAVADIPLDHLEWYHEKFILDYFAEAGLFMRHGVWAWAETTFRHLIKLRSEAPEIGPNHHETMILNRYLESVLRTQGKNEEAEEVGEKVRQYEDNLRADKKEAETSLWDSFISAPSDAYDMLLDPNRKEREEEENLRKEVKASKKKWRRIRQERFQFLDSAAATSVARSVEEKKE